MAVQELKRFFLNQAIAHSIQITFEIAAAGQLVEPTADWLPHAIDQLSMGNSVKGVLVVCNQKRASLIGWHPQGRIGSLF